MSRRPDTRRHSLSDKRLRYLSEVVSKGSMRKAAESCGIEASVISRQLQQMENELGTPLMERRGRGVVPTDAAQLLLTYYRTKLAEEDRILGQLDEINGLQRGTITIAASEGFIDNLMQKVLKPFATAYPLLRVNLEHLSVAEIVRRVAESEADIGLAYNPRPHAAVRELISMPQPVRLIVRHDHPLASAVRPIRVREILPYPIALLGQGYGLRQAVEMLEYSAKVQFTCNIVVNTLAALTSYVECGLGLTFLPAIRLGLQPDGPLRAEPRPDGTPRYGLALGRAIVALHGGTGRRHEDTAYENGIPWVD